MGIKKIIALLLASAAFAPYAAAQDGAFDRVVVEGSSSRPPDVGAIGVDNPVIGGGRDPCARATGNGGSGACGGGGDVGNPRPKTAQQIEAAKKRCDGSYARDTKALDAEINARYAACANSATSSVGVVIDRILGQTAAQACISAVSDLQKKKQWDIDLSRSQCYLEAERP